MCIKEVHDTKMRDKMSENHFQIEPDNRSESSESFLFDFHWEKTSWTHFNTVLPLISTPSAYLTTKLSDVLVIRRWCLKECGTYFARR